MNFIKTIVNGIKVWTEGKISKLNSDISNVSNDVTSIQGNIVELESQLATKQPIGNYADKTYVDKKVSNIKLTETDPTVPAWAKMPNKPSYTASEVGALPDTTYIPSIEGLASELYVNDSLKGYATEEYVNEKVPANIVDGNADYSLRTSGSRAESNYYQVGKYAFAEGSGTQAIGEGSHAEGSATISSGKYSHAEGSLVMAFGESSHAEGGSYNVGRILLAGDANSNVYTSQYALSEETYLNSFVINLSNGENIGAYIVSMEPATDGSGGTIVTLSNPITKTVLPARPNIQVYTGASVGKNAHSEGYGTMAIGNSSHAEGSLTKAIGYGAHAEGHSSVAYDYSHAEGYATDALGRYSHTEGYQTIASSDSQHVQGEFNIEDAENKYVHIVGNGEDLNARSNSHTLDWQGNAWFSGDIYTGSTSGINMDDGSKKLATEEYVDEKVQGIITDEIVNELIAAALESNEFKNKIQSYINEIILGGKW